MLSQPSTLHLAFSEERVTGSVLSGDKYWKVPLVQSPLSNESSGPSLGEFLWNFSHTFSSTKQAAYYHARMGMLLFLSLDCS